MAGWKSFGGAPARVGMLGGQYAGECWGRVSSVSKIDGESQNFIHTLTYLQ